MNFRTGLTIAVAAGLFVVPAFASRVHRAPTSGHSHGKRHISPAASHKLHGQQAIDAQRVTAIQQALIREHYLTGEPTAKWDGETQAAMLKFQADQGWQTKLTPDSRALIKLGLGPNHSAAINASNGVTFNSVAATPLPAATSTQDFVAASGLKH